MSQDSRPESTSEAKSELEWLVRIILRDDTRACSASESLLVYQRRWHVCSSVTWHEKWGRRWCEFGKNPGIGPIPTTLSGPQVRIEARCL